MSNGDYTANEDKDQKNRRPWEGGDKTNEITCTDSRDRAFLRRSRANSLWIEAQTCQVSET